MPRCKSCNAEIDFIKLKNGKLMPINGSKRLTIVTQDGDVVSGWESHFSSCPGAAEHRRVKDDRNP